MQDYLIEVRQTLWPALQHEDDPINTPNSRATKSLVYNPKLQNAKYARMAVRPIKSQLAHGSLIRRTLEMVRPICGLSHWGLALMTNLGLK